MGMYHLLLISPPKGSPPTLLQQGIVTVPHPAFAVPADG